MKVIKSLVYFKPCSARGENDCLTYLEIISLSRDRIQRKTWCKGSYALVDYNLTVKVHKNDNFFGSDLEFCTISFLVMLKY
jgi:hypothetical protein